MESTSQLRYFRLSHVATEHTLLTFVPPSVGRATGVLQLPVLMQIDPSDTHVINTLKNLQPKIAALKKMKISDVYKKLTSETAWLSLLTKGSYYAVASGRVPGIYTSHATMTLQIQNWTVEWGDTPDRKYMRPAFRKFECFSQALAFVIMSANKEYSWSFGTAAPPQEEEEVMDPFKFMGTPQSSKSTTMGKGNSGYIYPPSASAGPNTSTPRKGAARPMIPMEGITSDLMQMTVLDSPQRNYNYNTVRTFSGNALPYSHVRDHTGIIDTLYAAPPDDQVEITSLGKAADAYLQAHGYTPEAVESIVAVRVSCDTVEEFVVGLSTLNIPETEAVYLASLIKAPTGVTYTRNNQKLKL
ncbi:hypothetical protein EUX98_g7959 [Antrodiella citrinella]|uniref:Ribonuclease H1 N-terminal domain-containing protein n=1 Tax=Antrodiella citrinella TaxID=2447956 RepID=A0A4S4MCR3_9APHY|nr:hypothetical protein EUX98_g7959 [Antrodiella citrinella]